MIDQYTGYQIGESCEKEREKGGIQWISLNGAATHTLIQFNYLDSPI